MEVQNIDIEVLDYRDEWQGVKDAAMNTIGKDSGKYPASEWKRRILLAEHSPIRLLELTVRLRGLPSWVSVHLTRHHIGIEHFVSTQRTDRTGIERCDLPQSAPVSHRFRANAQAMINISRKRLCNQASKETREAWQNVILEVVKYEPELASVCVPECIYRGFCPEMKSCGYVNTEDWRARRAEYIGKFGE